MIRPYSLFAHVQSLGVLTPYDDSPGLAASDAGSASPAQVDTATPVFFLTSQQERSCGLLGPFYGFLTRLAPTGLGSLVKSNNCGGLK